MENSRDKQIMSLSEPHNSKLTNPLTLCMLLSLVYTFAILVGLCFPRRSFGIGSQQRFGRPERVLPLVNLWHREQAFTQAALGPGGPGAGAGAGRGLEAVPHLVGGLEGAKSSLLAEGVLIAGPVPAADHRLRGEAVHVCDHCWLRTLTPLHPPTHHHHPPLFYPGPKPPTPPLSWTTLSLSPPLDLPLVLGWRADCERYVGCVCRRPPPLLPKTLDRPPPSVSGNIGGERFGGFCNPQGTQSPSVSSSISSYCFCPSSPSLRGSYWLALICLTKEGCAQF